MQDGRRPRLIVMFEEGAVTPSEILLSLTEWADLIIVLGDSPYTLTAAPFLEGIAETTPLQQPRDQLIALLRQWEPDGIITYAERMLVPTAEIADALNLLFHSPETAMLLRDKYAQRRRLAAAGVQETKSAHLRDTTQWSNVVRDVGLPVVVKPRLGEGSQYTHLVRDEASGAMLLSRLAAEYGGELVAEEFIEGQSRLPFGDYVSVESYVVEGEITHLAITGKFPILPPFREQGHFWPAPVSSAEHDEIIALTRRALLALDIRTGITHTEVKLTSEGPRLIEVNGRIGGQINELALRACGVDLIAAAAAIAMGHPVHGLALNPQGTFFQYHNLPPLAACRLTEVSGVQDAKQVDGVQSYEVYLHPPAELNRGVMTTWIDVIRGRATNHLEMLDILDRANAKLSFTYDTVEGPLTAPAMWTLQRTGSALVGPPI
ncbi:ATP-grasp domain-containing protein [Krasilnikovia cinnamomea]|uniref:ATP-grasp domain-containing protein n=1 Tax=Krasilnikovia cinnamomea TaxID=349313 RepID=A0A4Q7ZRZ3_9ACTN|nr:ATP-grasp domain-containing protein [Krasilnikovia cinnamomea]RZU53275.1 ATP-grasp domain-containing protein [Krasilnikovia cinnamomea]